MHFDVHNNSIVYLVVSLNKSLKPLSVLFNLKFWMFVLMKSTLWLCITCDVCVTTVQQQHGAKLILLVHSNGTYKERSVLCGPHSTAVIRTIFLLSKVYVCARISVWFACPILLSLYLPLSAELETLACWYCTSVLCSTSPANVCVSWRSSFLCVFIFFYYSFIFFYFICLECGVSSQ